jgi:pectate lyase
VPSLADDFSGDAVGANPPAGWQVDDGQWAGVVGDAGHVLRHGAGQAAGHIAAGSSQWADYTVSADVGTTLLDLGFAGVAARYQGPGNGYECGIGAGGQLQLWVASGGNRRVLATSGVTLDLTVRHTVSLDVRGSQLTCSGDAGPSLHATDSTFATGRIALVASAEAAEYGNVRVSG